MKILRQVDTMRIDMRPAAMLAAIAFALLIVFSVAWPGHGVWMLALSLVLCAAAAVLWFGGERAAAAERQENRSFAPFRDTVTHSRGVAYQPAGAARAYEPPRRPGLPLAGLVGAIGFVALFLFIGGAAGARGNTALDAAAGESGVAVIDRTDNAAQTGAAVNNQTSGAAATSGAQQSDPNAAAAAANSGEEASTAPLRPIVVQDPRGAAPASQHGRADASTTDDAVETDESATADSADSDTFTYVVEAGDTLWDIANEFGVTVAAIAELNGLTGASIDVGDELAIPETVEGE